MENIKVLIDGIQRDVYGIFYIYDAKYYFIYTEKELDENGYVILYMTQIGRETMNTENGPVDTGYMIGVEITNPEEVQTVQKSISYIVEDKKNSTVNPQIQYLPMNMLANLKIVSKRRFRLMKNILVNNFKLQIEEPVGDGVGPIISPIGSLESNNVIPDIDSKVLDNTIENKDVNLSVVQTATSLETQPLYNMESSTEVSENLSNQELDIQKTSVVSSQPNSNVIIDYRSKYFEEEEKNKELQEQINELTRKLDEIKKVLE